MAWAEPTPGNSLVGLYNADTGVQSQIQASTPSAGTFGVTYSPTDNSLWSTEQNASQVSGWFYNTSIVRRAAPENLRLASLDLLPEPRWNARPALLNLGARAHTEILLVKKETKQATSNGKGQKKKAEVKKSKANVQQIALNAGDQYQPSKKGRKTKRGGGNGNGNGGNGNGNAGTAMGMAATGTATADRATMDRDLTERH